MVGDGDILDAAYPKLAIVVNRPKRISQWCLHSTEIMQFVDALMERYCSPMCREHYFGMFAMILDVFRLVTFLRDFFALLSFH